MKIKYNAEIDCDAVVANIQRLVNQTYKLLPNREEGLEWEKPLITIIEELSGMDGLLLGKHELLFSILCKLEGLFTFIGEDDFFDYRRTIFEILSLMNQLKGLCQQDLTP